METRALAPTYAIVVRGGRTAMGKPPVESVRLSVVAVVALLLATGCSARPSTGQAENDVCPPVASDVSAIPTRASGPVRHVELGDVRCSDADSGMSAVDITVKNTGTGEANYDVTVEFIDSEQHSLATEHTYFGHVNASATMSTTTYAVRPAGGRGLAVRLVEVKREVVPTKAPASALDTAVDLFVEQGLVPVGTPYGDCPDTAPQAYWIGDRGNCWTTVNTLPPLSATSTPRPPSQFRCPHLRSLEPCAATAGSPDPPAAERVPTMAVSAAESSRVLP